MDTEELIEGRSRDRKRRKNTEETSRSKVEHKQVKQVNGELI